MNLGQVERMQVIRCYLFQMVGLPHAKFGGLDPALFRLWRAAYYAQFILNSAKSRGAEIGANVCILLLIFFLNVQVDLALHEAGRAIDGSPLVSNTSLSINKYMRVGAAHVFSLFGLLGAVVALVRGRKLTAVSTSRCSPPVVCVITELC